MFQGNFFFLQGKRLKFIMFRVVSKTERKKLSLSRYGSRDDGRTDTCGHEYFAMFAVAWARGPRLLGFWNGSEVFLKIGSICDDALEHDLRPVLTSDIRIFRVILAQHTFLK